MELDFDGSQSIARPRFRSACSSSGLCAAASAAVIASRPAAPGLRDAAEALGVNINTVRSVYQRLEREGLIDSQQGSGTFVASAPQGPSDAATIAASTAEESREAGVDPREVAAAVYVSAASRASRSTRRPDGAVRCASRSPFWSERSVRLKPIIQALLRRRAWRPASGRGC